MNAALRVLSPGLVTTLQDLGRPGYARLGIPGGGALDPVALRAANALAGNPQDAGALEVTYAGPALAIDAQSARLAFAGADAAIEILSGMDATCGRTVETMRSVRLQRGQIVRIGPLIRSALLYIAVEGGFEVESVLGSVSTYLRGGFGGWQGRALVAGDRLPLRLDSVREHEEQRLEGLDLAVPTRLRVIDGPQIDYFSSEEIAAFFSSEYTVCAADRRNATPRPRAPPLQEFRHCLRRHGSRLDPDIGKRPADRAAGGPADNRRLSEDCDCRFSGPARARSHPDRVQDRLRTGHH